MKEITRRLALVAAFAAPGIVPAAGPARRVTILDARGEIRSMTETRPDLTRGIPLCVRPEGSFASVPLSFDESVQGPAGRQPYTA